MDFIKAYNEMDTVAKESFYKTVFMQDDSDYARKIRTEYYAEKLKFLGENVYIGKNVKFENPEYISIGNNVKIMDDVTIRARGEGGIVIGDGTELKDRVYLDTEMNDTGYIIIGKNVYIGTGTVLHGHRGLEIGDYCLLAQNITLTPYSHIFDDKETEIIKQGGHCEKVTIGADTYIGMGVTVMYSASIGKGCIIGSGSNCVKPIPDYSVAVGNPAKVIKSRK